MNNKVLVTVLVPMIEEEYNVYIPVFKSISVTKELLIKTINELSDGHFPIKNNYVLMSGDGLVYPDNSIVKECGIRNSDKVILI